MLDGSGAVERHYRAERAVAANESASWVVVDEDLELHVEACAYLAGPRGAGRAFNAEKTYAGRIALYLSYCRGHGLDWSSPSLPQLMAMMRVAGGGADAVTITQAGRRGAVSAARTAMTAMKDMHRATTFEAGNDKSIARQEFGTMAMAVDECITKVSGNDKVGPQVVKQENTGLLAQMIAEMEARLTEPAAD